MENLLTEKMYTAIDKSFNFNDLTEIRIRLNKPLFVKLNNKNINVKSLSSNENYIVDQFDISHILSVASNHSMYSVEDELKKGYITYNNGIRIGVLGEGVYVGGSLKTIKNISSLVVRIPHEIKGCSISIFNKIYSENKVNNSLILSRPGGGKTTILRDLSRLISNKNIDTLVIDERNEIAGLNDNIFNFDCGNADILTFVNKNDAYENVIRSCNPAVIITDEIFENKELEYLSKINNLGISIIASKHLDSTFDISKDKQYSLLKEIFNIFVVIDNKQIGKINKIIEVNNNV